MPEASAPVPARETSGMNGRADTRSRSKITAETNPRILGFDFGLRRIGVAVGNTRTGTCQGLSVVRAHDGTPDWPQVGRLLAQWRPRLLVVGLPLGMDGSEGEMAARARKFGQLAARRFGLQTVFVDERLTTIGADELLAQATAPGKSLNRKRAKSRDNLAAELILRSYLEGGRK